MHFAGSGKQNSAASAHSIMPVLTVVFAVYVLMTCANMPSVAAAKEEGQTMQDLHGRSPAPQRHRHYSMFIEGCCSHVNPDHQKCCGTGSICCGAECCDTGYVCNVSKTNGTITSKCSPSLELETSPPPQPTFTGLTKPNSTIGQGNDTNNGTPHEDDGSTATSVIYGGSSMEMLSGPVLGIAIIIGAMAL